MFIHLMQKVYIFRGNVTLARCKKNGILYKVLIFGSVFNRIIHILSTEYINI